MPQPMNDGWLYEDGIGEERAALLAGGAIIEARIERHGAVKAGLVAQVRLVKQLIAGKRGIAELSDGRALLLSPLPAGLTEGGLVLAEVRRSAISERTRFKLPLARPAQGKPACTAPTLLDQISSSGIPVRPCHAHEADHFGAAGWHEVTELARSGEMDFPGGGLIISVTPAMTVIDVDGAGPPRALAIAAADACARAIRLLGLQGSIGIDFPGLDSKADRQAAAEALDAAMTGDVERTAINGFGFMQIVKRRTGPSLPELFTMNAQLAGALELLRCAERSRGTGAVTIIAHPAVIQILENKPEWVTELSRRLGRPAALRADSKLAIESGYAE